MGVSTVEAHLSRVYRKLGVRSRTELAGRIATPRDAAARRLDPTRLRRFSSKIIVGLDQQGLSDRRRLVVVSFDRHDEALRAASARPSGVGGRDAG